MLPYNSSAFHRGQAPEVTRTRNAMVGFVPVASSHFRFRLNCSKQARVVVLEGKRPQRRPQRRLDRRLEEVAKAVGGGCCRLQLPLKLALSVRGTVAGRRLGALEGGAGLPSPPPPSNASLGLACKLDLPWLVVSGYVSASWNGLHPPPRPSPPLPQPCPRLQATGPLALGMQIAADLLAANSSLEEVHALQNAIATDLVPATLAAAPYIPPALQAEVSDLLQALLSNVWQNTATQQFDLRPELVEREEKMQGIVADHVSELVAGVLQDLGREHESEVWSTGSST